MEDANGTYKPLVCRNCGNCGEKSNENSEKYYTQEKPINKEDNIFKNTITFRIDENPPLLISIGGAFQILLATIQAPIAAAFFIAQAVCPGTHDLLFAELIGSSLFMVAICTFLQVTFGCRLPIVQGTSYAFIPPILVMMQTERWKCPDTSLLPANASDAFYFTNGTQQLHVNGSIELEPYKTRLSAICGGLMISSLIQVILGCTGVIGFLMNYIGPITIIPCIIMVGLSLFETATASIQVQWGIGILTIILILLFSLVLGRFRIPIPVWRDGRCQFARYPIFQLYPHILAAMVSWLFCYILTVTNVFTDDKTDRGYNARTDAKLHVFGKAQWLYIPYPGQWGAFTFTPAIIVGTMAATVASIVESIGDYYATARVCQECTPPKHAMNRGIAMEGLGSVLCGLFGAPLPTTSYSSTIGFIGMTKLASRSTFQILSLMFLLCAISGKFGALVSLMPDPIIGAMASVGLGMVISVALINVPYCDITSSRNQIILGVSIILAMMIPTWLKQNPKAINTGIAELDQTIYVFLGTNMLVGATIGFICDNLVPGSREERGIGTFNEVGSSEMNLRADKIYGLPSMFDGCLKKFRWCKYIPISPMYGRTVLIEDEESCSDDIEDKV